MKKLVFLAASLIFAAASCWAQEHSTVRVPTPFVEGSAPVTLEMVIYRPEGAGPFPTVVFNHGSTGIGNDPALFKDTWAPERLARWFTQRGWLVAFPQRRGRGQSDGLYDEGFTPKREHYSCDPVLSLAGFDHALADLDAAVAWLQKNPDVDTKRMEIAGYSRGGILAIAYAGTRPGVFQGVINFVGGWMSDQCPDNTADAINPVSFRRGAAFPRPTLWLYGEKDSFYAVAHSRKNFEAFTTAGGKGTFETFALEPGVNGHMLVAQQGLWGPAVEAYLAK
ncbi:dienelactone hydrolase [Variovorax boronicumulans]|uniref:dienelactone hydrolase family protein n=1 Tax=Variovorax boronicumulans TaxID=436515 RepID=UPI002783C19C|nr:dienelactone hydrolase family protein [Variovorax boronicumulans]MDQ0083411.1 dienelactone hydrolase [Variovorax boronicumulans]